MRGRMAQNLPLFLKQLLNELDTTLVLFLSCIISILLVFKLKRRSNWKKNLPPSPPKLPIIGNYHQLGALPHRSFQSLSQKFGPLMHLQLGQLSVLVVSSADVAREVMQTQDLAFASRYQPIASKILLYGCKDVLFSSYGEIWRQKRKICVLELLSLKRVQSLKFVREEEVAELINKIREAEAGSLNLSDMLIATSNNIVCRCIFGKKYDAKYGNCCSIGVLARRVMTQLADFSVGDLFPWLGWIDVLSGQIRKFKSTFEALDVLFDEVIAEHKKAKKEGDQRKDFLDNLLQLQDVGLRDFELSQDDLKALLLDMFLGGNDTTSTTAEWAMAELVKNPVTMKKAQEEVRKVVGVKSKIEDDDVNQMNYLKCIVKEILRLHPPAPLLAPRETTSNVKLRGYDIPAKTTVYVNVWTIQRDPKSWERSEEFLPERFINKKVDFKGQDFQFLPFGSGRRICPGMTFGLAATEYILANLLYWFDWKLPEGISASVHDLDMSEATGLTVTKKVPLHLEPIPYSNI